MLLLATIYLLGCTTYVLAECPINDRKSYFNEQLRLHNTLFKDYVPKLPAIAMQEPNSTADNGNFPRFEVLLTLVYMKLIQMVEPEQKVEFLFEYSMKWRDERLEWNPEDYCGLDNIYVSRLDVWIPDITIVDAHSSADYRDDYNKFVHISSIHNIYPDEPTVCALDVQNFPFDRQECAINMMSQLYSMREYGIKLAFAPALLNNKTAFDNMGNEEWRIKNVTTMRVHHDIGYEDPVEISSFVILMKRSPSFYITMIITPSFVINILSIFGVFLKSADSMGKLGMALTNIMSLTFILGILATALPKTKGLPKIAIYIMGNLLIMVFALTTTLVLPYVKRFLSGLGESSTASSKRKLESKLHRLAEYALFVLFEIANLVNFIVLIT
ncbi:unnamed protein product [Cylicocyclus nassatus]|uniref:Neurotransmitter-gated ion-channel ligand-binding domain-containing protein n=1 Tax=Cylicocyclus nassatus TaxID=53992 RepID=A0AA36H552_CYLNA|nr:unnamed protein product [Cylicocyclus nassatus]